MRKFRKMTYILLGMIFMVLLNTAIPVIAATVEKTIKVRTGVKVYVDDVGLNPVDANNKPVELFIYKGQIYVPAKALTDALGKTYIWEGKKDSVFIGKHLSEKPAANLLDMDTFYSQATYGSYHTNAVDIIGAAGVKDNIGKVHSKGFHLITPYYGENCYNVYLIDQKYSNFRGNIAVPYGDKNETDGAFMRIYGDDELLYESPEMKRGVYPVDFDIDVSGVIQLKIEWYVNGDDAPNLIFSDLNFFNK